MLYHSLKILHILGLTLFLGSIFGHIVSSVLGGEPGAGPSFIAAREHIRAATSVLTLPGLILAGLSGAGMMAAGRMNPVRAPWLAAHMSIAAVIFVLAFAVVVPAGQETLTAALQAKPADAILHSKFVEDVAGAVNVALTLVLVAVGVFKPVKFRKTRSQ